MKMAGKIHITKQFVLFLNFAINVITKSMQANSSKEMPIILNKSNLSSKLFMLTHKEEIRSYAKIENANATISVLFIKALTINSTIKRSEGIIVALYMCRFGRTQDILPEEKIDLKNSIKSTHPIAAAIK